MKHKSNLFQSVPRIFTGFCVALAIVACKEHLRPDDALEPNDTFRTATALAAGQVLKGRANQGNIDVFAVKAKAKRTIVFQLQSLGLEDCAAFTVTGPDNRILYQDSGNFCSDTRVGAVQAEGVKFTKVEDSGYKIYVPASTEGTYFLSIRERGQRDNLYPFSWDYSVKI